MAFPTDPNAASRDAYGMGEALAEQGGPKLTARQRRLMWLWNFYACRPYAGRAVDWDGRKTADHVEHEAIASQQAIPPGFTDVSGSMSELPLKFRKPTAPYYLCRAIVNKFTGMLFSEKRRPVIRAPDDPLTEAWLQGVAKDAQLWSRMSLARTYGGSMGSVGVGFRIVRGKPVFEVHDPRWSMPHYADRDTGELSWFEKKYQYQKEMRDPATGQMVSSWFWYRRVIDEKVDCTWQDVPVQEQDREPDWERTECRLRQHNYGFVPVVWIQNSSLEEGVDGWTDVEGVHELQMAIDMLQAQAHRGTSRNCDPTVVVKSNDENFGDGNVRKGSDSAIQVEQGGELSYLEMSGSGTESALTLVDKYRTEALEVSRCVLDANFDGPAKTETEVAANYSSMVEAADDLRSQYGGAIQKLLQMLLEVGRRLEVPKLYNGHIIREAFTLTPRVSEDPRTGEKEIQALQIGRGQIVELQWPDYRQPSLADLATLVTALVAASQAGIVDKETAGKQIAPLLNVDDVRAMVEKAKAEAAEDMQAIEAEMASRGQQLGAMRGG